MLTLWSLSAELSTRIIVVPVCVSEADVSRVVPLLTEPRNVVVRV